MGAFPRYLKGLAAQHNYYRWIEYSLSSSLMIVLIAMVTGISDVAALLGLAGVNASMIFFGAVSGEVRASRWFLLAFWLGCIAGAVPWVAIGIYLFSPGLTNPAGFVYRDLFSLFAFFNVFALDVAAIPSGEKVERLSTGSGSTFC